MKIINELLRYHKEILEFMPENEKGMIYASIGQLYCYKGKADRAIEFLKLAIHCDIRYNIKDRLIIDYLRLGNAYRVQKKFNKAKKYLIKGLYLAIRLNDTYALALSYKYLAMLQRDDGNLKVSKKYLNKSNKIMEEIGKRKFQLLTSKLEFAHGISH